MDSPAGLRCLTTIPSSPSVKTSALSAYIIRWEHGIPSRQSTIDDGDSLTPSVNPLFAQALRLRSHVLSLNEAHVVSPRVLNTFILGFSRAEYNIDSVALAPFDRGLSFVAGATPGGLTIGGG